MTDMDDLIKLDKDGVKFEFSIDEYHAKRTELIALGMKEDRADIAVFFELCDERGRQNATL